MKLRFAPPPPQNPNRDAAAKKFFNEVRRRENSLESATYNSNSLKKARIEIGALRDEYNRTRGDEYGGELLRLADCISRKVAEIVNLNPNDWTNYRRGQQFRRLHEILLAFQIAIIPLTYERA